MAEPVLSFVVDQTLGRMVSLITDEITLAWNLNNDIEELKEDVEYIRGVLQDAEGQQIDNKAVKRWLEKLQGVAYDAEDLFDKLAYEILRRKVESGLQDQPMVSCHDPFSKVTDYAKKIVSHVKIAHKVKSINGSLTDLQKKAAGYGLIRVSSGYPIIPQIDPKRVTDWVLRDPIVGREDDLSKIVDLLTCSCDQRDLTVVPIVGVGGLGKTALAKLVCKEVMSRKFFEEEMWICVSDNFNGQKIFGEMLQYLDKTAGGLTSKGAIVKHLKKQLERKKFLLVLDDLWDDMCEGWNDFKGDLLEIICNKGNAIVVTTRSEKVAAKVETSLRHRHKLNTLSDVECWSIIKNKVYGEGATSIDSELESIGKEIAEKCRGVPLAAKVLGGMLANKIDEQSWLSIKNNKVLHASHGNDNVQAILKLSFDHLPLCLKPCFSFCSMFPKDSFIEKEQLIQLWMAQGFVQPCTGDVGEEHFNALLCSSFFQDAERDTGGNITGCKMHDLVHDLAISLSKSEILTSENYPPRHDLSCIHHMNADSQDVRNSIGSVDRRLRTLFLLKDAVFDKSWTLKNLRALNLNGAAIEELPSSIGEWKLLRYIDISKTAVKALPESITKLYDLQTLRFLECWSLEELPKERMKNLVSLKHLEFSQDEQMPGGLGRLTFLESLPLFVVGSDRGSGIEELEGLKQLRGKLRITQLENVRDKEKARRANLQEKKRITSLVFKWSLYDREFHRREDYSHDEEVLDVLQPHLNIQSIKIEGYLGEKFPEWVMKMKVPSGGDSIALLSNLVDLKLVHCRNCEQLPSLGNLQSLKYLYIGYMGEVKYIGNELYGIDSGCGSGMRSNGWRLFPALKRFELFWMGSLEEWKEPEVGEGGDAVVVFPCLEEFSIVGCKKLKKIPRSHLSSLVKFEIRFCDELINIFDELPSLKSLKIRSCDKLTCFPSAVLQFTSLEELEIDECGSLRSIPEGLGKLNRLISLKISYCRGLREFPKEIIGSLTRLKKLEVGPFSEELSDFSYLNSIRNLSTSLEELTLHANQVAKSLPEQLRDLTSLKSLAIWGFKGMEELPEWLCNFSSLQSLRIVRCDELKKLPEATAMKGLSKLTHLRIRWCDHLENICTNRSGSEWDKISHIPNIIL